VAVTVVVGDNFTIRKIWATTGYKPRPPVIQFGSQTGQTLLNHNIIILIYYSNDLLTTIRLAIH